MFSFKASRDGYDIRMNHSTPTPQTDSAGARSWTLDGELHRTDGPAREWADGSKEWWAKGKRHRVDGPAIEWADGSKSWWVNGEKHRTDGPAFEGNDGDKVWYFHGELHRTDGPAAQYIDGSKHWYLNGRRHRVDGPASEYAHGTREWWLEGKAHRTDGPAVESADGSTEWYLKGAEIFPPCTYVLAAACNRGILLPEEAMSEMVAVFQTEDARQIDHLRVILHKHWPLHVKKILATLFLDPNPAIKHLALSLLGRDPLPDSISSATL